MRPFLILCFLWIALPGFAQDKVKVQIVHAGTGIRLQTDSSIVRILVGDVQLKHDALYMKCDSAVLFQKYNRVVAYGNVHLNQGDSIRAASDFLRYEGDKSMAWLTGNVSLKHNQTVIETDALQYNVDTKVGTYSDGAIVKNGAVTLTSKVGYYHAETKNAFFKDSVVLVHPDYVLVADTLQYSTARNRAYFYGPTTITSSEDVIYCSRGWYDTDQDNAFFRKNVKLVRPPQVIWSDSLYYEREGGIGKAYGNVVFRDTAEDLVLYAHRANYSDSTKILKAFGNAVLVYISEGDSLYIAADTLWSIEDTLDNRTLRGYPNVRVYRRDLQAIGDSVTYRSIDSVLVLYHNPVMWSGNTQFLGDTIRIIFEHNQIDRLQLLSHAFLASKLDSLAFNQIKGRDITGYFRNDTLESVRINGNGQSAYFARDEDSTYIGLNKTVCSHMLMRFKSNTVDEIVFYGNPEANLIPIQQLTPEETLLEGFVWRGEERPTLMYIIDPNHTRLPAYYLSSFRDPDAY